MIGRLYNKARKERELGVEKLERQFAQTVKRVAKTKPPASKRKGRKKR